MSGTCIQKKDPSRVALGVLRVIQIELCTFELSGMAWRGVTVSVSENTTSRTTSPIRFSTVSIVCKLVYGLYRCLFLCLFRIAWQTNKQTNEQTLCGLGGMQAPHSWPFAIRTSHAENSRFYVKKKEKKAKHKNSNNCKVWVVFECGGRHNCFWCTSWEEMTMRLKCLLRRFI